MIIADTNPVFSWWIQRQNWGSTMLDQHCWYSPNFLSQQITCCLLWTLQIISLFSVVRYKPRIGNWVGRLTLRIFTKPLVIVKHLLCSMITQPILHKTRPKGYLQLLSQLLALNDEFIERKNPFFSDHGNKWFVTRLNIEAKKERSVFSTAHLSLINPLQDISNLSKVFTANLKR